MRKNKKDIIIESLSHIEFIEDNDAYVLWDKINDQKYDINKTTYEICSEIDGTKSLEDIANSVANKYNVQSNDVKDDVFQIYLFLKKNGLCLCKGTMKYNLIKFYSKLIFLNE